MGSFLDASAIYAGGSIYAQSEDGTVRAFDLSTGRQTWTFDLKAPGSVGSPLFVQKNPGPSGCAVVAASPDGTVSGLEPSTGRQLWSIRRRNRCTPVLSGPRAQKPRTRRDGVALCLTNVTGPLYAGLRC